MAAKDAHIVLLMSVSWELTIGIVSIMPSGIINEVIDGFPLLELIYMVSGKFLWCLHYCSYILREWKPKLLIGSTRGDLKPRLRLASIEESKDWLTVMFLGFLLGKNLAWEFTLEPPRVIAPDGSRFIMMPLSGPCVLMLMRYLLLY